MHRHSLQQIPSLFCGPDLYQNTGPFFQLRYSCLGVFCVDVACLLRDVTTSTGRRNAAVCTPHSATLVLCRFSLLLKQASNLHCGPGSRLELLSGCGQHLICVLVGRDNTLRFYSKQLERRRMKSSNLAALHIWLFAQQRDSAMFHTNKVGLAACIHTVTSASKMAPVCERRCDWR